MDKAPAQTVEWRRQKAAMLSKTTEPRSYNGTDLEVREQSDGTLTLTGYASVYDRDYDMGWYVERVARGAGKRSLSEDPDVQLLVNHAGLPLARTISGTLRLSEDDRGLYVEADLDPEDPDVTSLVRKMNRGDIDQMSFAFRVTADGWNEEYTERTIRAYSIHRGDVSVVNMGANDAASASVRSRALESLRSRSRTEVLEAFMEIRAGKTLSAATMDVLTQVLSLVATADEAVDEAQPLLADLMGVSNPDDSEDAASVEDGDSVERSIGDARDACAAIRDVVRSPEKDERRAQIIERAKALDVAGLLPDAWNQDGTLKEGRAVEQRETYNDTYTALQAALDEALEGGFYWCWVQDFTDSEVIYYAGGDIYSAPYTLQEGGAVTIGDGVKVRPVTQYVELTTGDDAERSAPAPVIPLPNRTTRARQEIEMLRLRSGR